MRKETVSVIGVGRFGRVLVQILSKDFTVQVFDENENQTRHIGSSVNVVSLREALAAPVIFYAVPISTFAETIKQHAPLLKHGQKKKLIIDVLSVKQFPKEILERYLPESIDYLLTHPMFGPDSLKTRRIDGLPLVICGGRVSEKTKQFWKAYFIQKKLKVVEMTAQQHDQFAASSQGVAHFIGRMLDDMGMQKTPVDTIAAQELLDVKELACHDTWQLFTDLQTRNPYTRTMRISIGKAFDRLYNTLLPVQKDPDSLLIGIQGGKGSFNEAAAIVYATTAKIGRYELEYLYTTKNVLEALHQGDIDRGIFALANSVGGIVEETKQAIGEYRFSIIHELMIPITHSLMIRNDAKLQDITVIMTHPQVVKQCESTIKERYGKLKIVYGKGDAIDPAKIAEQITQKKWGKNVAVMGNPLLAEKYSLKKVADHLEDREDNTTTFVVVERRREDTKLYK
ncbi:prephenate dehydrogenase/arogenate dehydrogenase family protein [Candidatus Woesearchaeota archaeon]|nr:prephenate dehydrogenase/arogenate dehydrogenase family protein [Candidatus Woesearchaeota archaeon]